jgi:hypothetical protein
MECTSTSVIRRGNISLSQGEALVSWLETLGITALIPGIAFAVNPLAPSLLEASFLWVILAPILTGSRYGFSHGLGSALTLIAGLGVIWHLALLPMKEFPTLLSVSLLLAGMITGEFRNLWARRLHHLDARCKYQQTRLDEFSRVYHLLKASHTRLEQQVTGSSVSLRTALLAFRQQLSMSEFQEGLPLGGMGERILRIFGEYGGVRMAAVYQVTGPLGIHFSFAARLGKPPRLSTSNPLLLETLKTGQTVSIRGEDEATTDGVLAVVPLVDVHGQVWGVVTIQEMAFIDFHHRTLELLAIIGGYIGDALRSLGKGIGDRSGAANEFRYQLNRCLLDVGRHGLPAGLITLRIIDRRLSPLVVNLMRTGSRGLDQIWVPDTTTKSTVICALLPFTEANGVSNYLQRLEGRMREKSGLVFDKAGVTVNSRLLTAKDTAKELIAEIEKILEGGTGKVEVTNDGALFYGGAKMGSDPAGCLQFVGAGSQLCGVPVER